MTVRPSWLYTTRLALFGAGAISLSFQIGLTLRRLSERAGHDYPEMVRRERRHNAAYHRYWTENLRRDGYAIDTSELQQKTAEAVGRVFSHRPMLLSNPDHFGDEEDGAYSSYSLLGAMTFGTTAVHRYAGMLTKYSVLTSCPLPMNRDHRMTFPALVLDHRAMGMLSASKEGVAILRFLHAAVVIGGHDYVHGTVEPTDAKPRIFEIFRDKLVDKSVLGVGVIEIHAAVTHRDVWRAMFTQPDPKSGFVRRHAKEHMLHLVTRYLERVEAFCETVPEPRPKTRWRQFRDLIAGRIGEAPSGEDMREYLVCTFMRAITTVLSPKDEALQDAFLAAAPSGKEEDYAALFARVQERLSGYNTKMHGVTRLPFGKGEVSASRFTKGYVDATRMQMDVALKSRVI